jgi:hypothetical protein
MYEPQSDLESQFIAPNTLHTYTIPAQPPPDMEMEVKLCRCCQMTDLEEGDEFIAPCKCSGSIKYVHRSCLDKWRAVSPQPESFYRCDICHTPYVFKEKEEKHTGCDPRFKIASLITLDLTIIFVVWQVLVFICTGIVYLCDWHRARDKHAPEWASKFLIDYVCGLLLFFFLMGLAAIVVGVLKAFLMCIRATCEDSKVMENYTYDTYPYHRSVAWEYLWLWYWPIWFDPYPHHCSICDCCLLPLYCCSGAGDCARGCNCSGVDCSGLDCNCSGADCNCSGISAGDCKCSGSNDCKDVGAALAIVALVIIIIIIVIGVLFALYLAVNMIIKVFSNRMSVLYRKGRVTELIVADLDKA